MPAILSSALSISSHSPVWTSKIPSPWPCSRPLGSRACHHPHSTEDESEAQRRSVTLPKVTSP